jgi:hypothetical protein
MWETIDITDMGDQAMTLTLELPPELETQLQEVAAQRGQDVNTFATAVLADTLRGSVHPAATTSATTMSATELSTNGEPRMTWEEFEAAIDGLGDEIPVLAPEATTRAGIYGDHD